jgi:hypothetical protein
MFSMLVPPFPVAFLFAAIHTMKVAPDPTFVTIPAPRPVFIGTPNMVIAVMPVLIPVSGWGRIIAPPITCFSTASQYGQKTRDQ